MNPFLNLLATLTKIPESWIPGFGVGSGPEKPLREFPLEIYSPMVLEIPGFFSSPFHIDIDYP